MEESALSGVNGDLTIVAVTTKFQNEQDSFATRDRINQNTESSSCPGIQGFYKDTQTTYSKSRA